MLLEIAMWTLITVTNGGKVNESQHATKESCEQARSIALTGMTVEENKAADQVYADYLKKYEEDHPWRDPKDDNERQILKSGGSGSVSWGGPYQLSYDSATGKVREYPSGGMSMSYNSNEGETVDYVRGGWVRKSRTDIKSAKCVPPASGG
jgi:hypothetical protein